ncbi:NAD regulator [soil metagenome]
MSLPITIRLNAAIVAVTDGTPRILTLCEIGDSQPALPFGQLDTNQDRTLELGVRRWVRERTGLELGYVEQLYTFGDLNREQSEPARVLSVTYLALIQEGELPASPDVWWQNWYQLFPWEDHRAGQPEMIDTVILPALDRWANSAESRELKHIRNERVAIAFGAGSSTWDPERVLDRYELLWEAGLVEEYHQDQAVLSGAPLDPEGLELVPGRPLAYDHRRITATAISRIRGKIQYRPVVFELLPDTFTLLQLQQVVEALSGTRLHKQNFRRLVERAGLVEGTGETAHTGGRPAELFRFRRDVLLERPSPGVGLPGRR